MMLKLADLPLAIAALVLMSPSASAQDSQIRTFHSIELASDPSAMIDDVRTDLAARIPSDSPTASARGLLGAAGAHCRTADATGRVWCRYRDLFVEEGTLQDVSWTIKLMTGDGKVKSFSVAREQRPFSPPPGPNGL